MLLRSTADGTATRASAFWLRLVDNMFRRLVWFVLPIVALAGVGLVQADKTLELYRSTGTLSASSNPLLPAQEADGLSVQYYETLAGGTSRIINEQLRTDQFLDAVAERAGLADQIDNGILDRTVLRSSVWASESGNTILAVNAQWSSPQTAYALTKATIDQFKAYLAEQVASTAAAAEEFYTDQLPEQVAQRDAANDELNEYVESLGTVLDDEQDRLAQLGIDQLANRLQAAETKIDATQANIDQAKLAREQQMSKAGQSFNIIDAPEVPGAPQSTLMQRIVTVASFVMLGLVLAAAALLVTTALDQTVVSNIDLLMISGVDLVATIPKVALPALGTGAPSLRLGRKRLRGVR